MYKRQGYGHLIEPGETMPNRISQQKADELFDKDYDHHKTAAMKIPGYDKASGMQKAALIDLTFNMGPAGQVDSQHLRKHLLLATMSKQEMN